ncbi:MAG: putative sulfate/molybdate transporter [Desulfosalsimonas sp.]
MEFAGSLGDLGTLLPIAIAMVLFNGLNPMGLFFSIGLFYIIYGLKGAQGFFCGGHYPWHYPGQQPGCRIYYRNCGGARAEMGKTICIKKMAKAGHPEKKT